MARLDEAFWREQESRHQSLEQPCCTQSNISWSLVDLPGDLVVVIHGESDCLNCFFHHLGRNTTSYYSTRLTERQLIAGDTGPPLRRLLELIVREREPEAVFVLGTCPVELIGDPFEQVVAEVARESGVAMRALRTHGLALMSQAACQDWLYAELAGLEPLEGSSERALNLVGLPYAPAYPEAERLLSAVGVRINGCYPNGTSLRTWRSVSNATTSFVVDRGMFPQLVARLGGWQQRIVDVPLPVGLEPTRRFYRTIAAAFGSTAAMDEALEPMLDSCRRQLEATRRRVAGRRLAACVRMGKTHRTDRLAYDGLGELPLLQSVGFEITLFVQGPPEPTERARFAERLSQLGYGDVPFEVFEGPWKLGERLAAGGFELALLSDVARNVVEEAGVQMLAAGTFRPLLSGMPANLRLIERVVEALA